MLFRSRALALEDADLGLLAVAKVQATDQLAHDDNLGALGDVRLERRVRDERRRGEQRGPDVGVQAELLAELEQAEFGAQRRVRAPLGPSDRACAQSEKER